MGESTTPCFTHSYLFFNASLYTFLTLKDSDIRLPHLTIRFQLFDTVAKNVTTCNTHLTFCLNKIRYYSLHNKHTMGGRGFTCYILSIDVQLGKNYIS